MSKVNNILAIDIGQLFFLLKDSRPDLFNLKGILLCDLEEDIDEEFWFLRGAELRFLRNKVVDDLRFLGADSDEIVFG